MAKKHLSDEEVEREIKRLTVDDDVRLARAEQRIKYRKRQYLYQLRDLKKRGAELRASGIDESNIIQILEGNEDGIQM